MTGPLEYKLVVDFNLSQVRYSDSPKVCFERFVCATKFVKAMAELNVCFDECRVQFDQRFKSLDGSLEVAKKHIDASLAVDCLEVSFVFYLGNSALGEVSKVLADQVGGKPYQNFVLLLAA